LGQGDAIQDFHGRLRFELIQPEGYEITSLITRLTVY
jgi:hypothetical protein